MAKTKPKPSSPPTLDRAAARVLFEQQRQELLQALRSAGLDSRIAEFEPRIRDTISISLRPKSRARIPPGVSRLGGVPDLPPGTPWPEAEGEPLSFVGQIALEDVAPFDIHDQLPRSGLLSIFFGDPLNAEQIPTAHAHVIHVDRGVAVEPAPRPEPPSWWSQKTPQPQRIAFSPMAMLPNEGEQPARVDVAYRDFHEEYYDLGNSHPRHGMLCFDYGEPAHDPGEVILLRVDEDDLPYSYDWCEWVRLYVVIAADALAQRDFSATRACQGVAL